MTKTYSLYEAATGLFTGKRLYCDDEGLISMRLPAGILALEGKFDHCSQRMDLATGVVVEYRQPAQSVVDERNSSDLRWQVKSTRSCADRTAIIHARIHMLEATQGRAIREATLGDATAIKRLQDIDAEINDLRKQLARG
jgi:hypothetical protein